jgi:hypothetical protein
MRSPRAGLFSEHDIQGEVGKIIVRTRLSLTATVPRLVSDFCSIHYQSESILHLPILASATIWEARVSAAINS